MYSPPHAEVSAPQFSEANRLGEEVNGSSKGMDKGGEGLAELWGWTNEYKEKKEGGEQRTPHLLQPFLVLRWKALRSVP